MLSTRCCRPQEGDSKEKHACCVVPWNAVFYWTPHHDGKPCREAKPSFASGKAAKTLNYYYCQKLLIASCVLKYTIYLLEGVVVGTSQTKNRLCWQSNGLRLGSTRPRQLLLWSTNTTQDRCWCALKTRRWIVQS